MPDHIYPDFTKSQLDINYTPALAMSFDVFLPSTRLGGKFGFNNSPGDIVVVEPSFQRIDGGFAASAYLATQLIDGGGANG